MEFDERNNFELTEEEVALTLELQKYIKSDDINGARTFIEKLSPETRHRITKSKQGSRIQPTLFVTIDNGNIEFVKFLVDECRANFFDKVYPDDTILANQLDMFGYTKCMTPLEVAISKNKLEIVAYLFRIGPDVDGQIKDKSRSIMDVAFLTGSLETVKMLIDHGIDVNASDESGYTCLMTYIRNVELCRLLLDNGADVNKINNNGETALHMAAKLKHLSTVKLLVERGADATCRDKNGCDSLHLASWNGAKKIVNFLNETVFKDVNRHIEALQVLGARFGSSGDFTKAMSAWRKAIELSLESGISVRAATFCTHLGVAVEATTLAELDEMDQNNDRLYAQCIVLTYKHYGSDHLIFLGVNNLIMSRYFKMGSYDRWLKFVIYCLKMMQKSHLNIGCFLHDGSDIYSAVNKSMNVILKTKKAPALDFDLVYELMIAVIKEATTCSQIETMSRLMCLIVDTTLMFVRVECDNNQIENFRKLLQSVVKPVLRDLKGNTLLLCLLKLYGVQCFRVGSPHFRVITLLLECGADINERDVNGNNVLHLVMMAYEEHFRPILIGRAKTLAATFVNHGIHLDARNRYGRTVTSCLQKLGISVKPSINLMCSAARAIRRFNIAVEGILPSFLADFVAMH